MLKVIPFELDELTIKKAIAFGSVVAISAIESDQLIADDTEVDNI